MSNVVKVSLAALLNNNSNFPDPRLINKIDENSQKKIHLSYSVKTGWGIQKLSNFERLAKILPDCFLNLFGLNYIANTKLSHILRHRNDDVGKLNQISLEIINNIFSSIWVNKYQQFPPGDVFFQIPPLTLQQVKEELDGINRKLKLVENYLDQKKEMNGDSLKVLAGHAANVLEWEAEMEKFKLFLKPAEGGPAAAPLAPAVPKEAVKQFDKVEVKLFSIKKKLVESLAENKEEIETVLKSFKNLEESLFCRKNFERLGVSLSVPKLEDLELNDLKDVDENQPVVGIPNTGNNCYVISILQCLLASEEFQKRVRECGEIKKDNYESEDEFNRRKNILIALKGLMTAYNTPPGQPLKKVSLYKQMIELRNAVHLAKLADFTGGIAAQQDACDVLRVIFQALEINEFKQIKVVKPLGHPDKNSRTTANDSYLMAEIYGKSLTESIAHYFQEEDMEELYVMNEGNGKEKKVPAKQQIILEEPFPSLLPIQLKRFLRSPNGEYSKISDRLNVNEIIDFSPYIEGGAIKPVLYRVVSVVSHQGSLEGGHYWAHVRLNKNRGWFNLNDASSTPVAELDVSDGYLFILEKIKEGEEAVESQIGKWAPIKTGKVDCSIPPVSLKDNGGLFSFNQGIQALFSIRSVQKKLLSQQSYTGEIGEIYLSLRELFRQYHDEDTDPDHLMENVVQFRKKLIDFNWLPKFKENDIFDVATHLPPLLEKLISNETIDYAKGNHGFSEKWVQLDKRGSFLDQLLARFKEVSIKKLPDVLPVHLLEDMDHLDPNGYCVALSYQKGKEKIYRMSGAVVQENGKKILYLKRGKDWYFENGEKFEKVEEATLKNRLKKANFCWLESN